MPKRRRKQGFFQRFKSRMGKAIFGEPAKKPVGGELLMNQHTTEFVLTTENFQDWVDEAYKRNPIVNRAINLLLDSVCESSLIVCDDEGETQFKHPTHQLLQHMNDHDTQKTFLKRLLLFLYLGNVAYVEKVYTSRGVLTELQLLRPDKVKTITGKELDDTKYRYEPGGSNQMTEYMMNEIIPIRFQDPSSRVKGFSPLHALAYIVDSDNEQTEMIMSVLKNGGVPGSILTTDQDIDDYQAQAIRKSFDRLTSGAKRGSTTLLPFGIGYERFGSNLKDLEASSLRKLTEAQILSALGIPLPVFGGPSGTEASTYDNMRTAMKIFWRQTIIPLQSMLEDFLNNDADLMSSKDKSLGLKIKFDRTKVEALKEDQDLLSTRARENWKAGIMTLNEVRQANGLEPVNEGGDEFFSIAPSFSFPAEESEEKSVKSEERDSFTAADYCEESKEESPSEESSQQSEEDKRLLKDMEIAHRRLKIADKSVFKFFTLARKHLSKHIADTQKLIAEQKGEKNDPINKTFNMNELRNGVDQLVNEWTIALQADSLGDMEKLIEEAGKDAAAQLNSSFDIQDENVDQAIKSQQYKFANKVSSTSADQIKAVMGRAFDDGLSLRELKKEIQKLGDQFNSVRAEMIARTETVRASNQGARMGYRQSGVELLRYSAVLDDKTSDICTHLNGKIVSINESFFSESSFTGPEGKVTNLSYSDGVPEPPAHPNCRSVIIPEFRDGGF